MRPGAYVSTLAWNEVRALLPTWVACVLTAGIAAVSGGEIHMFSLIAFTATAVGLGAQAVGHEYGHRTLISMLALPVGRGHLLLAKLVVLAAMVLPLAVFASVSGLFAGHQALP